MVKGAAVLVLVGVEVRPGRRHVGEGEGAEDDAHLHPRPPRPRSEILVLQCPLPFPPRLPSARADYSDEDWVSRLEVEFHLVPRFLRFGVLVHLRAPY